MLLPSIRCFFPPPPFHFLTYNFHPLSPFFLPCFLPSFFGHFFSFSFSLFHFIHALLSCGRTEKKGRAGFGAEMEEFFFFWILDLGNGLLWNWGGFLTD